MHIHKVIYVLASMVLFSTINAYAQSQFTNQHLYDTIPYMPEFHKQRVADFRNAPVTTGGIVFLGNSITEGGNWAKMLNDSTVLNRGISGDITYGILKRLDEVTARQPHKLFIMIGINDIAKDIPVAVIAANYRKNC